MDSTDAHGRVAFVPGASFPDWVVVADNDAIDSGNPIHEDAAARRHGFGGGLVPGVTTYGYMSHPLVAALGMDFLRTGQSSVRLRRPIYAGQTVTVATRIEAVDEAGSVSFTQHVRNPDGEICATGTARWPSPPVLARPAPPWAALPVPRRPATPESLRAEPVLGTLELRFDAQAAPEFLARQGETLDCYATIAHPGWLLRQANYLVDRSLAVGPWVHTASEVTHLGVVEAGEFISVRGEVVELSTHKGHDYADIDVLIATADRPVMRVLHRAIYRMGEAAEA